VICLGRLEKGRRGDKDKRVWLLDEKQKCK
jgi:hypothetical protein